jgi:hypothetical protein
MKDKDGNMAVGPMTPGELAVWAATFAARRSQGNTMDDAACYAGGEVLDLRLISGDLEEECLGCSLYNQVVGKSKPGWVRIGSTWLIADDEKTLALVDHAPNALGEMIWTWRTRRASSSAATAEEAMAEAERYLPRP